MTHTHTCCLLQKEPTELKGLILKYYIIYTSCVDGKIRDLTSAAINVYCAIEHGFVLKMVGMTTARSSAMWEHHMAFLIDPVIAF